MFGFWHKSINVYSQQSIQRNGTKTVSHCWCHPLCARVQIKIVDALHIEFVISRCCGMFLMASLCLTKHPIMNDDIESCRFHLLTHRNLRLDYALRLHCGPTWRRLRLWHITWQLWIVTGEQWALRGGAGRSPPFVSNRGWLRVTANNGRQKGAKLCSWLAYQICCSWLCCVWLHCTTKQGTGRKLTDLHKFVNVFWIQTFIGYSVA